MYVLPLDMKYNSLNEKKGSYLVWPTSSRESRSS